MLVFPAQQHGYRVGIVLPAALVNLPEKLFFLQRKVLVVAQAPTSSGTRTHQGTNE